MLSLTDVLTKCENKPNSSSSIADCHHESNETLDVWNSCHIAPKIAAADIQHALKRTIYRGLGRTEPNETAETIARHRANKYPDRAYGLEVRLKEFLSYSDDWDGDGAKEIPSNAVIASLNFLDEVRRRFAGKEPSSAAPSPDGEIVLYWHSPAGYAEVNFFGSGKLSICWSYDSNEIQLIEEDDVSTVDLCKSRVWKTLSEFLDQRY